MPSKTKGKQSTGATPSKMKTSNLTKSVANKKKTVYMIKSKEGKPYVGMTTGKLGKRIAAHRHAIKAGHGDGKKFTKYYKNHSFDDATVKVLGTGASKTQLLKKEQKNIQKHNSLKKGLNSEL